MTSLVHRARLLGFLLARGPGAISLDALLARQFDRHGSPMRAGA